MESYKTVFLVKGKIENFFTNKLREINVTEQVLFKRGRVLNATFNSIKFFISFGC